MVDVLQHHSILIVEDEAIVALDLHRQFERAGFVVPDTVGVADAVMPAVQRHRPSAVLMDVRLLGDVDGVTLAEEIFVCEDVPVVFLSAFSDQEVIRRAARSGAYGYLTKPVSHSSLISTVEMAIYKHHDLRTRRREAQWLSQAFHALGAPVVGLEQGGQVHFMNRAAVQLTGWMQLEARDGPAPWAVQLDELAHTGDAAVVVQLRTRADAPVEVRVRKFPLPDGGGSVCLILSGEHRGSAAPHAS